ncbi:hypothetical protein YC2023_091610 [Brassica napus]
MEPKTKIGEISPLGEVPPLPSQLLANQAWHVARLWESMTAPGSQMVTEPPNYSADSPSSIFLRILCSAYTSGIHLWNHPLIDCGGSLGV